MIMNVTAQTDKMKELILQEYPNYYSLSAPAKVIAILKFINECDAETMYKYMEETEIKHLLNRDARLQRLKTLDDYLNSKYPTDRQNSTHHIYYVKPVDINEIIKDYMDVLLDSNVFISPASNAYQGFSYEEFEVYAADIYFGLKSKKYDRKAHFDAAVRMNDAEKIQVDISGGTILSFQFYYSNNPNYDQISFRND